MDRLRRKVHREIARLLPRIPVIIEIDDITITVPIPKGTGSDETYAVRGRAGLF